MEVFPELTSRQPHWHLQLWAPSQGPDAHGQNKIKGQGSIFIPQRKTKGERPVGEQPQCTHWDQTAPRRAEGWRCRRHIQGESWQSRGRISPKEHGSLNTAPLRNPIGKALPLTHRYHIALLWRQNQKGPAAQASVQHTKPSLALPALPLERGTLTKDPLGPSPNNSYREKNKKQTNTTLEKSPKRTLVIQKVQIVFLFLPSEAYVSPFSQGFLSI